MKITTSTSVLSRVLGKVKAAVGGKKESISILQNALFKIEDEHEMKVIGSSSELYMEVSVPVAVEGKRFDFCLPYGSVTSALALMPEQPITLDVQEGKNHVVTFSSMDHNGKVTTFSSVALSAEAYPFFADPTPLVVIDMQVKDLLTYTKEATKYAADNELRPVMNGIYLDVYPDKFVFVASDGHRLYRQICPLQEPIFKDSEHYSADIPKVAISALSAFEKEETVKVFINEKTVKFESPSVKLMSVLYAGRYPNYNHVIPASDRRVVVNVSDFIRSARLVRNFASANSDLMRLKVGAMLMDVVAEDLDFSESGQDSVAIVDSQNVPGGFQIGLNAGTLLCCLSDIHTENVIMEVTDSSRAIIFKEDSEDSNLTLLAMPMQLND